MKRIAPITLALALVGTGCIVDSHDNGYGGYDGGDVIVYWDFVRNAPAQSRGSVLYDPYDAGTLLPNGMCAESGVESVSVETPVGRFDFDCVYEGVQGATLQGMPRGTSTFTITGWRGTVAVYRSSVAIPVDGAQHGVDVEAVSAPIDLFAYFRYGPGADGRWDTADDALYATCSQAGEPEVFYDVYDSFGTKVLSSSSLCAGTEAADPFLVYAQSLDLDDYTVRMTGYDAANRPLFDSCTQSFSHFDAQGQTGSSGVAITLDNPVPTCR